MEVNVRHGVTIALVAGIAIGIAGTALARGETNTLYIYVATAVKDGGVTCTGGYAIANNRASVLAFAQKRLEAQFPTSQGWFVTDPKITDVEREPILAALTNTK